MLALRAAWRWPLVGDDALIRYVVFLIGKGKAPYTQIKDINLPGSYFFEYLSMRAFGWGAVGLRLYDGLLCGLICVLAGLIARRPGPRGGWFGVVAGLLFLLIHLQDGLFAAGQRDLLLSVLMLGALGAILIPSEAGPLAIFGCEVLVGVSLAVKPTLLPLALLPLFVPRMWRGESWRRRLALVVVGVGGLVLAPLCVGLWLWRLGSFGAFRQVASSIGLMHGELARRPVVELLSHAMSPIALIFLLWIGLLFTRKIEWSSARAATLFCVVCGLASYLEQGKGLAYQRYPFLVAALVLMLADFGEAWAIAGVPRILCGVTVGCIAVFFAPRAATKVMRYSSEAPFQQALGAELASLGVVGDGVQCFDTYSGCVNTLYDLRIVQATGYLYDCYLFQPAGRVRDSYRAEFLRAFDEARPRVVVATDQPCFGERGFDRLASWPALAQRLGSEYVLADRWSTDRSYLWWSRPERPVAFEVYVRR